MKFRVKCADCGVVGYPHGNPDVRLSHQFGGRYLCKRCYDVAVVVDVQNYIMNQQVMQWVLLGHAGHPLPTGAQQMPVQQQQNARFPRRSSSRPIDSNGNYASLVYDIQLSAYTFRFAYDPDFLALFKQYVLGQNRVPVYVGGKFSHWVVDEKVFDSLRNLCEAKWPGRVRIEDKKTVEDKHREAEAKYRVALPTQPSVDKLFKEFEELVGLPVPRQNSIDDLKKWYRAAAVKLHPDKSTGDATKMARLNAVWKELQKLLQA